MNTCPQCHEYMLNGSTCLNCGFGQLVIGPPIQPQPTPAQGSVSDTPETDALDKDLQTDLLNLTKSKIPISEQVNHVIDNLYHVIGNLYKHARILERELDAFKDLCHRMNRQLEVDTMTKIDMELRQSFNEQYQQLTQKEKKV